MTIHVVQPGQTLETIAVGYGVDPRRLAADNAVEDGRLAVGQTLVVRFPRQVHAVQPGETLSSIAAELWHLPPPAVAEQLVLGRQQPPCQPGQEAGDLLSGRRRSAPPCSTAMPIPSLRRICWRSSCPISPAWRPLPTASPPSGGTCSLWRMRRSSAAARQQGHRRQSCTCPP